jgi:hypothetical protein
VALLTLAAARIAAPSGASHYRFSAAMVCGIERWNIKTLKDRPLLKRATQTTVAHLVAQARPASFPPPGRLAFEHRVFNVIAAVTLDRTEADLDHHLVLTSGGKTMIAETPSPICTHGATAYRRRQMTAARSAAVICSRARVTGVAFFDFLHGQTGVAPNGIELHPVLGFSCLAG